MSSSSGSHPEGADGPRVVVRAAVPADARRIREIIDERPGATAGEISAAAAICSTVVAS